MAVTGNGSPRDEIPTQPPFPRRSPPAPRELDPADRIQAPAKAQAAEPVHDFMARIENAAALLTDVGAELGHVGQDDAQALRSFASTMQQNVHRYVSQLVERKRRELADLERILGKL